MCLTEDAVFGVLMLILLVLVDPYRYDTKIETNSSY